MCTGRCLKTKKKQKLMDVINRKGTGRKKGRREHALALAKKERKGRGQKRALFFSFCYQLIVAGG